MAYYDRHIVGIDRELQKLIQRELERDSRIRSTFWSLYGRESIEMLRDDLFLQMKAHPELLHDRSINLNNFNRLSDETDAIIAAYQSIPKGSESVRDPICLRGVVMRGVVSFIGQSGPPGDSWWGIYRGILDRRGLGPLTIS